MKFRITTDACSDLPLDYAKENDIKSIPMEYNIDDNLYYGSIETNPQSATFYKKLIESGVSKTSMINTETHKDFFRNIVKNGEDIIHIAFSSALSGTANAAKIAAEEIMEEFPTRKVIVVDSLAASVGEGLLVTYINEFKKSGKSFEECVEYAEKLKLDLVHMFTVMDLNHLHKGGRISKMTAVVGSMLKIKPVLHVNEKGQLIALRNVRTRKKSLNALVDDMVEKIKGYEDMNKIIYIGHGDSEKDAKFVADKVIEKTGYTNIKIAYIGPIIGSHSGPGTIALFFIGQKSDNSKPF